MNINIKCIVIICIKENTATMNKISLILNIKRINAGDVRWISFSNFNHHFRKV